MIPVSVPVPRPSARPCRCSHQVQDHSILDIGGPCLCCGCDCSAYVPARVWPQVVVGLGIAAAMLAFGYLCMVLDSPVGR